MHQGSNKHIYFGDGFIALGIACSVLAIVFASQGEFIPTLVAVIFVVICFWLSHDSEPENKNEKDL